MNMKHCLTLLFALLAHTLLAQEVVVDASLDSTAILIGEQVQLSTRVACRKGAKVKFPDFAKGYVTDSVEMLHASRIDTAVTNNDTRWELTRTYTLTAFDSAVYVIPKIEVEVDGHKYQSKNELGLKVNTVDVDLQHPDDFRPLKAPVEGIFTWRPWLILQCLILWALIAASVYCYFHSATAKPLMRRVKVTPPTPPQTIALQAINELKGKEKEGTRQKEYFMALTDVLRTYLHGRFNFESREMTSGEIIRHLETSGDIAALEELREVLATADLVKFAKYSASLAESDRALLQAANYVQTTQQEIPETSQPTERIVLVVGGQQRQQFTYKVAAGIAFFGSVYLMLYIGYELWLNFL